MKILRRVSDQFHALAARLRASREKMSLPLRITLAILFLILGVAGLFLPVLQGGLFLFIAAWLLFPQQSERWLKKTKAWLAKFKKKN